MMDITSGGAITLEGLERLESLLLKKKRPENYRHLHEGKWQLMYVDKTHPTIHQYKCSFCHRVYYRSPTDMWEAEYK